VHFFIAGRNEVRYCRATGVAVLNKNAMFLSGARRRSAG